MSGFATTTDRSKRAGSTRPDSGATASDWERFYRGLRSRDTRSDSRRIRGAFRDSSSRSSPGSGTRTESGSNHLPILLINAFVYPFCLVGIWSCMRRRQRKALVLLMPVVYLVLLHCATFAMFRYMVPVMPYLLAFAAVAVVASIDRFAGSSALAARLGLASSQSGARRLLEIVIKARAPADRGRPRRWQKGRAPPSACRSTALRETASEPSRRTIGRSLPRVCWR